MEEGVGRWVNLLPLLLRTDGSSEVELMEAGFKRTGWVHRDLTTVGGYATPTHADWRLW